MFSKPLFVYGALMFPSNLLPILGRIPLTQDAAAFGFKRLTVKGDVYPTIVRSNNVNLVRGKLIYGLRRSEIEKIEMAQSELYDRIPLKCKTFSGEELCWSFQLKGELVSLVTQKDWSINQVSV